MGLLNEDDLDKVLKDYFSQNSILIVDSVSSARVSLAATLTKLGAVRQKMALVGSMEEARSELEKLKPKIVFSDFMVGDVSGLDLLQDQKRDYTDAELKKSLFILVTSNASQSTVARAAEEDVDTFIIKPYTIGTMQKILYSTIKQKLNPSRYMQLIEAGKQELFQGNYDQAIHVFEEAMGEHEQPTLACFYAGQAEFMKTALGSAEKKYAKGLSYNKIHYKCLIGLYDLLMTQKKYVEAYDVIRRLAQYFPANPKRLASVLRLAILTENFSDMDEYYKIFLNIGTRTDDLTKYMCSALVVTGKHYLRKKAPSQALKLFESASVSAAGRTHFLAYIIEALVDFGMREEAERYLERMGKIAFECKDYLISNFLISTLQDDLKGSIQMGRNLLSGGLETPTVYEKLIIQSIKGEYVDAADELFREACKKWPEKEGDFTYAREIGGIAS